MLGVDLVQFDIHSRDGTVLRVAYEGILLAGDTLEDTVTYVSEPEGLATHLTELERLRAFACGCRIYPNHGSVESIAGGGYADTFITATEEYVNGSCGTRATRTRATTTCARSSPGHWPPGG